jgi:hypothetical protein
MYVCNTARVTFGIEARVEANRFKNNCRANDVALTAQSAKMKTQWKEKDGKA